MYNQYQMKWDIAKRVSRVQLLLSTLLNVCVISIISKIVGRPFSWIFYLNGFIPVRITAGAFHAKTPLTCSSLFCGSFFACLLLLNIITTDEMSILLIIINGGPSENFV